MKRAKTQPGFTLIEISIVLVIIGFIVGGVIVGQEMIHAAQIRATISQLEKYAISVNVFKNKYQCLPGDCANAVSFDLGTSGGVGDNGDGDGQVYSEVFMADNGHGGSMKESLNFWYHLSIAKLLDSTYAGYTGFAGFTTYGGDFTGLAPHLKIGSNAFVSAMTIMDVSQGDKYFGNAFLLHGQDTSSGGANAGYGNAITAMDALQIDTKMDDGAPAGGRIQANYPYRGPKISANAGGCGCAQPNGLGGWAYDTQGNWQCYFTLAANTPPNPSQIGCTLAVQLAW